MLLAGILLAAAPSTALETDFLAQIQAGKILCLNPDDATKTCSTIDTFVWSRDGRLLDIGEILISADQPITLEVKSDVELDRGAACGVMALADLQNARVRLSGQPVSADRNAAILEKLIVRLKPMAGRRVCETLRFEAGMLLKYGQADRIDINLPGKAAKWVLPTEGYKVAPR